MFSSVYQGKYGVEVLSSAGKDPLNKQSKLAKASSSVSREYDRTTKGYVFVMEKASSINCIQCPASTRQTLGLTQRYLILQFKALQSKDVTFQVSFFGTDNIRRRLHFSSKFRNAPKLDSTSNNDLHVQLPINMTKFTNRWGNVILDMQHLASYCFKETEYASIDGIELKPVCRLRKIFTLPAYDNIANTIPSNFEYLKGTNRCDNRLYDIDENIIELGEESSVLTTTTTNTPTSRTNANTNKSPMYMNTRSSRGILNSSKSKTASVTGNSGKSPARSNRSTTSNKSNNGNGNNSNININSPHTPSTNDTEESGVGFTPSLIRKPRAHLTHYDESPFKRTAKKWKQAQDLRVLRGHGRLNQALGEGVSGSDCGGDGDYNDISQTSSNTSNNNIHNYNLDPIIINDSELEKLPSPALSKSVDMKAAKLSPVPKLTPQPTTTTGRFADIQISPEVSVEEKAVSNVDGSGSGGNDDDNVVSFKAHKNPLKILEVMRGSQSAWTDSAGSGGGGIAGAGGGGGGEYDNPWNVDDEHITLKKIVDDVISGGDDGDDDDEILSDASPMSPMSPVHYSTTATTGRGGGMRYSEEYYAEYNMYGNDNDNDVSNISYHSNQSRFSNGGDGNGYGSDGDVRYTGNDSHDNIQYNPHNYSMNSTINNDNNDGNDDDEYDIRDQERRLENTTILETSVEDIDNDDGDGDSMEFDTLTLEDHHRVLLARRSQLHQQQQLQQLPRIQEENNGEILSPTQPPHSLLRSGSGSGRVTGEHFYLSDSDSDIDVNQTLSPPRARSSFDRFDGNNGVRGSGSGGSGRDALLDSRVFGADWPGTVMTTSSTNVRTSSSNGGGVGGSDVVYDPAAAANRMVERLDALDAQMIMNHHYNDDNTNSDNNGDDNDDNEEYHNLVLKSVTSLNAMRDDDYDVYDDDGILDINLSNVWESTDIELESPTTPTGNNTSVLSQFSSSPTTTRHNINNIHNRNNNNRIRSPSVKENYGRSNYSNSSSSRRPNTSSGLTTRTTNTTTTTTNGSNNRRPKSSSSKDNTKPYDLKSHKIKSDIEKRVKQQKQQEILQEKSRSSGLGFISTLKNDNDDVNVYRRRALSPSRMSHGTGLATLSDIELKLQQEEAAFLAEFGENV